MVLSKSNIYVHLFVNNKLPFVFLYERVRIVTVHAWPHLNLLIHEFFSKAHMVLSGCLRHLAPKKSFFFKCTQTLIDFFFEKHYLKPN